MGFRFEFDPAKKILLARFEGRITDESFVEFYDAIRKYSAATDASAGVADLSSVTEFALSAEGIRKLAEREPAMKDHPRGDRIIVAPSVVGFGLMRMFQILGEPTRPLLQVFHTLDEAFAALGVQSSDFEPLD
jgi:hypothetical protein